MSLSPRFWWRKSDNNRQYRRLSYVACEQLNVVNMRISTLASAILVAIGAFALEGSGLSENNMDLILFGAIILLIASLFASIASMAGTLEVMRGNAKGTIAMIFINFSFLLFFLALLLIAIVAACEL